ncbi:putative membrane protein (TIGR02226 family) [Maribacter vaceletii]|uniref:Putative membrane protein (TIGR02226 family) n=1 Tax=Maribacter vaceletii TaxID=1206816 RepID=A0A495E8P0_9FLAO|nr:BatA domain-containing protein [Maribacter vaceletii]RKR13304.1 putative membrane protein (TIGR02226 family) [Maribacter vaceletii]
MLFKYPDLLWGLFLLVIPIIIHLFQLRKFKKTPFTNVKLLQEVIAESRKSSSIKKWLLLLSRLGIIAALILAFAQPFLASKTALAKKETVIYIDNSFSMQATTENGTLLNSSIQELLKAIPKNEKISLFTNNKVYKNVTIKEIQNNLLSLEHSTSQLPLDAILLKASTLFSDNTSSIKNSIVISDFQENMAAIKLDSLQKSNTNFIVKRPSNISNISIDSLYLKEVRDENLNIIAKLTSATDTESTPVSLYNNNKLIAKTAAVFNNNKKATVTFTIPKNETIHGKLHIVDKGLKYDNNLYFNLAIAPKIKVLVIGKNNSFLNRIYTKDKFSLKSLSLKNLNYSLLQKQNTIVLNELATIPNSLTTALHSFTKEGGTLIIIPDVTINTNSYKTLTSSYYNSSLQKNINKEQKIANITFNHPLYTNVFEKKVTNFQNPITKTNYTINSNAPTVLSYQNNAAFLIGSKGFYLFSASLSKENSNFKNSPLIVPTFYSMATQSLKLPKLYTQLGTNTTLDLNVSLGKDQILKVKKGEYQFIPRQISLANKVSLSFFDNPTQDGTYQIINKENIIQNISFNYPRKESNLLYVPLENLNAKSVGSSIENLFTEMQKNNSINALWKWFVILALLFVFLEIIFQKFLK